MIFGKCYDIFYTWYFLKEVQNKMLKIWFKRHSMILYLIAPLVVSNIAYFFYVKNHINIWVFASIQLICIVVWFFLMHKQVMIPNREFIDVIKSYISSNPSIKDFIKESEKEGYTVDTIRAILKHQQEQEKQQHILLEQLKNNNLLLERNSKITDSIMQITSEVLSSGEIDETLQTILDKAIEIVPNAQKGSILIYDGEELHFRAAIGYDFDVLKNLSFSIKEIFQYDSKDFYQPCIINNPESYNRKHLNSSKYDTLKEGRGFEVQSILSCAILVDNEFYGIINLDNTENARAFTEEDKPLIKHLAVQIGIALKNTKLIEKILYLSRYDSLTDIYNRCYFEELLAKCYQQCKGSRDSFSLVIFDINDLKQINDTYGHEAGNLLIRKFVQGVQTGLDSDVDMLARIGGDEFAAIFMGKDNNQVEKVISSVKTHFADNHFSYCGKEIAEIMFGYGIATFPTDAMDLEELFKLADERMYTEKKRIKNTLPN